MVESAPHSEADAKKRRSTRIVQAVPLSVTGVDALGRPFQERTSTLLINCHGCRYQSKHYVLKNMWVTLEVPHPETGREPRGVRARVTWIQRPRTVRELFQIGVELEIPGNVWGIAFPPEDWFPFPDGTAAEIPALTLAAAPAETEPLEPPIEQAPQEWVLPTPAAKESNLRVLPGPADADTSLALARQVARLVVEAKQQVQNAVREATAKTVAAETRPLLTALHNQLKEAAEKSVQAAVSTRADEILRQTMAKIEEARDARTGALGEHWQREIEQRIQESGQQLSAHLTQIEESRQAAFEQQLEKRVHHALENLKKLSGEITSSVSGAEASIQQLRKQVDESAQAAAQQWRQTVDSRADEVKVRLAELEQAARQLNNDITAATGAAQSGWRARLDADLAAAGSRWSESIESSIDTAARQAAERLARHSQDATGKLEQDLTLKVAALRQSFQQATAESESTLGTLRAALDKQTSRAKASLADVQQAADRLDQFSTHLDAMSQATAEKLREHFEAILAAQSQELHKRAETAVAGMAERLQPVLETTGQQTVSQLASQLEQQLAPQLDRARELAEKLAVGQNIAEQALHDHQDRARRAADQVLQESLARLQHSVRRFEKELQEAGGAAASKWLAEIDAKGTEVTHATFEAIYKSSEWYEKKVSTQMQASLDKGLDQATNSLRERAGEISGVFASELDHYSRTYVEHSQTQMDEAIKDAIERGRTQVAGAADAAGTAFRDTIHQTAQREFERFNGSIATAYQQTSARMDTQLTQVCSRMESDARQFFSDFQKRMAQQILQGAAQARQELEAQVAPTREAFRAERESQEQQLHENLSRLNDDSIEGYKKRLENVSNSWLVTTVTKLTQQSNDSISSLASTAEERLRQACTQVFADVGETLRRRLLDLAPAPPSSTPSEEK